MKASKTENRFKTGFQQPKTSFPKKSGFDIPNPFVTMGFPAKRVTPRL